MDKLEKEAKRGRYRDFIFQAVERSGLFNSAVFPSWLIGRFTFFIVAGWMRNLSLMSFLEKIHQSS